MKKSLVLLASMIMSAVMSFSAYAGHWEQQGEDWYYLNDDGTYAKNTVIDGYYVSYTGRMINEPHMDIKKGVNIACQMVMNGTAKYYQHYDLTVFDVPYKTDTKESLPSVYREMVGFGSNGLVGYGKSGIGTITSEEYVKSVLNGYVDLFNRTCLGTLELPKVERYKAIADVVVNHMSYDNSPDVYRAIYEGVGNCVDYAGMYKVLCNMAGLDCDVTVAVGNHNWNYVTVDGVEYWIDTQYMDTDGAGFMVPVGSGSMWDEKAAHFHAER